MDKRGLDLRPCELPAPLPVCSSERTHGSKAPLRHLAFDRSSRVAPTQVLVVVLGGGGVGALAPAPPARGGSQVLEFGLGLER